MLILPNSPLPNNERREVRRQLLAALLSRAKRTLEELLRAGFSPAEIGWGITDLRAAGIPIALIHDDRQPLLTASVERTDSPSPA